MNDRELLELAAKAAGIVYNESFGKGMWVGEFYSGKEWNPLNDDGDAFRLAVKLGIGLAGSDTHVWACKLDVCDIHEPIGDDIYAATRRAITRAAAAIEEAKCRAAAEIARAADAGGKEG